MQYCCERKQCVCILLDELTALSIPRSGQSIRVFSLLAVLHNGRFILSEKVH
jgi:hypothetical protein